MDCIPVNTAVEKSRSASIFPQGSVKPFFMKRHVVHDDMPFGKTVQQFVFKPLFEHISFHRSAVGVRSKQSAFTLCRNKPDSSIALAADANIDPFSSFIANCLLKWHPEPVKRNHIDEHSQQPFALKRSTCAQ